MTYSTLNLSCLLLLSAALLASAAHGGFDDRAKQQIKRPEQAAVDADTLVAALREALEQGAGRAVAALGRENGFWAHPTLRIPMPESLSKAENGLRRIGQAKIADDFIRSLNRAAENATPLARDMFIDAIRRMTIKDATDILKGPNDAATQYFRRHTAAPLAAAFLPIVARSTQSVGVTARYKQLLKRAQPLGLVNTRAFDVDGYVTRKALDGLFHLVAEEEQQIRTSPAARTSELLRKVFR
jgi:hypothetical protein